jgi:hypothetical protein
MAVGRERFRADAGHVMTFLQQLQGAEMDPDDPTSSYMLQASTLWGVVWLPFLGTADRRHKTNPTHTTN